MSAPRTRLWECYAGMDEKYPKAMGNVYCGAGTGPGWLKLVEPVIAVCEEDGVEIHQIKEKFGGLRIYTGPSTPRASAAISAAESESFRTYEDCGEPGKSTGKNWIRTTCEAHAEK